MSTAITEAPPAPTRAEVISHLQKTVSPSRLSTFLQCRLKFFFQYVEGLTKLPNHVGSYFQNQYVRYAA